MHLFQQLFIIAFYETGNPTFRFNKVKQKSALKLSNKNFGLRYCSVLESEPWFAESISLESH